MRCCCETHSTSNRSSWFPILLSSNYQIIIFEIRCNEDRGSVHSDNIRLFEYRGDDRVQLEISRYCILTLVGVGLRVLEIGDDVWKAGRSYVVCMACNVVSKYEHENRAMQTKKKKG